MSRLGAALAIVALVLLVALSGAPSARAAVYWGSGEAAVGAARLDGLQRMPAYFRTDYETYGPISAVAVSPDYLYWGGSRGIGRIPLYGPEIAQQLVRTESTVNGLAVDGSHLYWTTRYGTSVDRANLDGSEQSPLVSGLEDPCGVAVNGSFVYWAGTLAVGRARLDGSGVERGFLPTTHSFHSCGVAVDSDHIYWGDAGGPAIRRAPLGGGASEVLFDGVSSVSALAVDSAHLYWNEGFSPRAAIGRLGLAGAAAEPNWLTIQARSGIDGVAVDSLEAPPPLPPISMAAEVTAVKHDRRKGFVFVDVGVPVMGKLRVLGQSFAWKIVGKKDRAAEVPPGKWRIKLWPGRGTASAHLRSALRRRGRASAKLTLSFKEFGKDPATTTKRVTFLLSPPRSSGSG
jgi:hypothetical protein